MKNVKSGYGRLAVRQADLPYPKSPQITMPNILIRIPQDCLPASTKAELAARVTEAAARIEQIPQDPACRSLCWVMLEEIAAGCWTCGGIDMTARIIPVMLQIYLPAGVVDDTPRAHYAAALAEAIKSVLPGAPRRVVISSVFIDVADGYWGVDERIWRLGEFAQRAGYRHLQHLAQR